MGWITNGTRRTLKFSITKTEEEGHEFLDFNEEPTTIEILSFNFQNQFTSLGVTYPALNNTEFAQLSEVDFNTRRSAAEQRILSDYGPEWNLSVEQWASLVQQASIYFKVDVNPLDEYSLRVRSFSDEARTIPMNVSQKITFGYTWKYITNDPGDENASLVNIEIGTSEGVSDTMIDNACPIDNTTKYRLNNIYPTTHQIEKPIFMIVLDPTNPEYDFTADIMFEYATTNTYSA